MSLDISAACPCCRGTRATEWAEDDRRVEMHRNITHNVRPICAALGADCWEWHGRRCRETVPEIEQALRNHRAAPRALLHLNPKNGWGSVDSAVDFLVDLLDIAKHCPEDSVWEVSR